MRNNSYYIMDFSKGTIFALNYNYGYITKKSFSEPAFMIAFNASLFITGDENIRKTEKYLNLLQTYNESGNLSIQQKI